MARLTALILAAVKAGYVPFLTSPRNSPATHRALFNKLKCRTLITSGDPVPPPVAAILGAIVEPSPPRHLVVLSLEKLLSRSWPMYRYHKTFQEARWDLLFIIQTSGSTGLPKPLVWTHESGARFMNLSNLDPPDGEDSLDRSFQGKRVIVTLPQFHGAALCQYLFNAVPFGSVIIAPVADAIATAQGLVGSLKQTQADVAVLVPSLMAELAHNDELLEYCAQNLELIIYIGDDLPQATGDRIAAKVPLRCQWGASEVGIPQQLMLADRANWRYIRFHPAVGTAVDDSGLPKEDGLSELVIRREQRPGTKLEAVQTTFTIRGHTELAPATYAWCWRAHASDDTMVFLNGEKPNPISMEQHVVARNPGVASSVLVVGARRLQAALLVEPAAGVATADQAALIERVWPSIQEANRLAPAHTRVEKSMILVIPANRPLTRAGKGTIQRSASVSKYASEIEKLYADADIEVLGGVGGW
ncbi:hypothetical protein B0H66DRAFT_598749 [Apodospora peruviana]|uniref:AMP-dependent synthetase/ligase domain-containing protein n=1 Tax=Apodospora peruviana TaxID=516989 RepID=A0AAE0MG35_9PEZI|nr:hypothetical protein B0H66DRAFT_598749 [Apodospora peruviana]